MRRPVQPSWPGRAFSSEEAADRTLEVVRLLPRGSEIVLEYMVAPELLAGSEQEQIATAEARKRAMGINEPTLTRFIPAELEAKLRRIGFSQVHDFSHEDGNKRYFKDRRDGLAADPAYRLMRAIV